MRVASDVQRKCKGRKEGEDTSYGRVASPEMIDLKRFPDIIASKWT